MKGNPAQDISFFLSTVFTDLASNGSEFHNLGATKIKARKQKRCLLLLSLT